MTNALPPAPSHSAGHAPLRRHGSVRRTSTIDVSWPNDQADGMTFDARARDLLTPFGDDATVVLAWDRVNATLAADRSIQAITATPERPGTQLLVGARGGGHLRQALEEALPAERDAGTPLYLLIDDFAGVSLVGPWVWTQWPTEASARGVVTMMDPSLRARRLTKMEGVCIGFKTGATSLADHSGKHQNFVDVGPLPNPDDPIGWHPLPDAAGPTMRRSRRIDIWREGDLIHIEAMFQDSGSTPAGPRKAIHEYTLNAAADANTLRLTQLSATPRILPYPECPSAVHNIDRLIGTPLESLRSTVLQQLPKTLGCTHLNDALRSLAEVPALVKALDGGN